MDPIVTGIDIARPPGEVFSYVTDPATGLRRSCANTRLINVTLTGVRGWPRRPDGPNP
jgi:hypothetical protein